MATATASGIRESGRGGSWIGRLTAFLAALLLAVVGLGQPVLAEVLAPVEQGWSVAPSVTPGVRGLAGAGDELAQGGVYALRDPITGQVVRTGRTNSLTRRAGDHLRDPSLADYEFEIIARTDVYAQQRGLEQLAHDAYTPTLNRIRPISPTNPNLTTYVHAANDFLSIYGGG